jgi:2-dehydro-3-deoxygalactonokinase
MNRFLSCDWGTSTLRINLVDSKTGQVLYGENSDEGIARTFKLWSINGNTDEMQRINFYIDVLHQHIKSIERKLKLSLKGTQLFISGMASSTIGFIELPYSELPFSLSGLDLKTKRIPANDDFEHDITIISGIKSYDDVIRGEETQLLGCIDGMYGTINNQVCIFPGTHSKHIYINNNEITGFKTYMTGDFFELLSQKSILSNSVETVHDIEKPEFLKSFIKGIIDACSLNLLNAAFKVRTNSLFDIYTKKQNFNYLSGLVIGSELKDLKDHYTENIHLLCGSGLERYYRIAIEELGLGNKLRLYSAQWVDEAVVRAHFKINDQAEFTYG